MKPFIALIVIVAALLPHSVFSQLSNGGLYANFGVDADTRSNYMKYGLLTGSVSGDDWFSPSLSGNNVIDTSNAALYLSSLQSGTNIAFSKRMSVPLYSKVNGKLWLDAAYGRDYLASSSFKDSTGFVSACKNGDDPSSWNGGASSFPAKDDLVDVYAHMRRDGNAVTDSLWLFTGVSTYGTTGNRYYDIELYKNSFSYDPASGRFTSAGMDGGHTQWLFDASGNIIQTGDMVVAISYSPGLAPVVDIRIWVSQTTWSSVTPAYFNFNSNYNGSASFGYASIVSKAGATAFGAGISNYSATSAQDTTYSTPWGTNSNTGWVQQYQSQQFIEVGLNVTRIGLDPALYTALGPSACQSLFSNIFFKSRSSNSFTSNLQDFVIPLVFLRNPVMDYSLQPDTLRCNRTSGMIRVTNNTTIGYYTWQTSNGNITGTNTDSSQININKPGTYILSSSPARGCPATRKDTIIIPIDTFPPEASVNIAMVGNYSYLQLYGGDVNASNYLTPFGGSQGLLWNWTGPKAFTSTIQNPRTADTAWGTYQLIVTEKRNGCTDTATKTISVYDFTVLLAGGLVVTGDYANGTVVLRWTDIDQTLVETYEIEKLNGNNQFTKIGTVPNQDQIGYSNTPLFSIIDYHPLYGNNFYRVRAVAKGGKVYYSDVLTVANYGAGPEKFYLAGNSFTGGATLVANAGMDYNGVIVIYNIAGQKLRESNVQFGKGINTVELSPFDIQKSIRVITLFVNGKIVYSQKVVF